MADPRDDLEPTNISPRGRRRLILAGVLVAAAELLHAVLSSVAVGSIYPVAAFRFVVISALAVFVILSRLNWSRWLLVVLGAVWAVGYGFQAASRMSFDLAVIAALLAAGVILLVTKPVSAQLKKRAA